MVLAVPNDQQGLVRGIQTQLENWGGLQGKPDPSILIALNLAEDPNLSVIMHLVQQIKETAGTGRMLEMRNFYISHFYNHF